MKKKIICICIALILVASCLAACSGGTGGTTTTSSQPVSETGTAAPSYGLRPSTDVSASDTQAVSGNADSTVAPTGAAGTTATPGAVSTTAAAVSTGNHKLGKYTTSSSVTLRIKPDGSSGALNTLSSSASVDVLAVQGDWGYVAPDEINWGWVSMNELTANGVGTDASSSNKVGKYTVNTQSASLTLRMKPESGSTGILGVEKGTAVEVLAVQGDWGYVALSGISGGWLSMEYLKAAV